MKKNFKKAFTIIELIVVIALIAILATLGIGLNFKSLSDKQIADNFANQIITNIEEARDEIVTGKGIYDNDKLKYEEIKEGIALSFSYEDNPSRKGTFIKKDYDFELRKYGGAGFGDTYVNSNKYEIKNIGYKGKIENIYCGTNLKIDYSGLETKMLILTFNKGEFKFLASNGISNISPNSGTQYCRKGSKEIIIIVGHNGQYVGIKFDRISGIVEKVTNNKIDQNGNYIP